MAKTIFVDKDVFDSYKDCSLFFKFPREGKVYHGLLEQTIHGSIPRILVEGNSRETIYSATRFYKKDDADYIMSTIHSRLCDKKSIDDLLQKYFGEILITK
ncbi:MAG: hypothetical protein PHO02_03015 [Candidatus Nanoarchaeia archaeon]|nr:hypothetical protein [Candidatus Nanoarchaeia archaeon]